MDTPDTETLAWVRQQVVTGMAKKIREASRLSQGDIARHVHVASATVSRWESNERLPSGEAALRYGALLRKLRRQSMVGAA
ncbi:MAG TPA: helix-turn-helix domain-containing protein [Acidothermaceae bacterium]